jgi:hypothetical protein
MIDLSGRFKLVDGFAFYLLLGAGEPLAHQRTAEETRGRGGGD